MKSSLLSCGVLLSSALLLSLPVHSQSLYERLDGEAGMLAITNAFIEEISFDAMIYPYFRTSDISRFRAKFSEQLCVAVNGPCEYTGDSMLLVHRGMGIDEKTFNRTVELLQAAMTREGVRYTDQNRILKQFAAMRADIIHQ